MSDHKGAAALFNVLPTAKELVEDRGYDGDGFRAALAARGITPYIPPRKNRKVQHPYCKALFRHVSATKLRMCSPGSWTSAASPCATALAPLPSCHPLSSPQWSSSGSNECVLSRGL